MQVEISPDLEKRSELAALAEKSAGVLSDEIDLATARASWDYKVDSRNRPLLVLNLRDSLRGEAHADFTPVELTSETHLRARLHDLKGAMLLVSTWRGRVDRLFRDLRPWIAEAIPDSAVQERSTLLIERASGPYEMPAMTVFFQGKAIDIEPVACWVVGADGRVDVRGPLGDDAVLLVQNEKWYWLDQHAVDRLQPLTRDHFMALLQSLQQ
ncbi:MAG TPA: hypothetical protein VIK18_17215 [Pirellulales bacterium]